ncbi:MAG: pro-sigmaK processing inhibitor BofA family protein [Clostridia bacterium]|nr:pro-sigmaK processing inhibitor BofA family protein [Clostridia bacterium]MBO7319113.1 pro-sigmaK processing inhibitor BofA family protein [Clostridia bacterium]
MTAMIVAVCLSALIMLVALIKSGHFFGYIILTALSGVGSLFAVNLLSSVTGVSIALNYITLSVSSFFGIPGVIGLLLCF